MTKLIDKTLIAIVALAGIEIFSPSLCSAQENLPPSLDVQVMIHGRIYHLSIGAQAPPDSAPAPQPDPAPPAPQPGPAPAPPADPGSPQPPAPPAGMMSFNRSSFSRSGAVHVRLRRPVTRRPALRHPVARYGAFVLNDDVHTYDDVARALNVSMNIPLNVGYQLARETDQRGYAVFFLGGKSMALLAARRISVFGFRTAVLPVTPNAH